VGGGDGGLVGWGGGGGGWGGGGGGGGGCGVGGGGLGGLSREESRVVTREGTLGEFAVCRR